MTKKVLAVLVVGILVLCAVFASKTSVEVQVSPFSFQKIKLNTPAEYDSEYGWGAKVGYIYNVTPQVYAGVDFSYSNFKIEKQDNRYLVWSLMAKGGVFVDIAKSFKVDMALQAGADLRVWGDLSKFYPTAGFYLGGLCSVSENLGLTAGADLRFAWQDNKDSAYSSMDTDVMLNVGVRVDL